VVRCAILAKVGACSGLRQSARSGSRPDAHHPVAERLVLGAVIGRSETSMESQFRATVSEANL